MFGEQQRWEELSEVVTDLWGHRAPGSSHLSPLLQRAGASLISSVTALGCLTYRPDSEARERFAIEL